MTVAMLLSNTLKTAEQQAKTETMRTEKRRGKAFQEQKSGFTILASYVSF
jgi:hypothetical protein